MIPEDIRAAFQWWANHPWMAFWGITLFAPLSIIILENTDLLDFAYPIYFTVLVMAWK